MKKIIFFILTLISTNVAYNQCVSGGTAANPACGGSTSVANVGSKNFVTLTTTAGNSYCVELLAGNDSGNAYSLQYTSFVAAGGSQNVEIYAGGGCNWYSTSRTSSTLTLREASPTNTTSTAAICEGSTKSLSASVSCGSFSPTWSDNSASGSISGTTYSTGNITANETVTVTAALGSCTSPVSFIVYAQPTASNTTSNAAICENQTKALTGSFSGTSGAGTESWSIQTGGGSISGTTYTPANVNVNTTVTIRYSVTNGTCSSFQDVSFTVAALDNASFNYGAASYCVNTSDPTPTISGLTGGTFSSTGGLSLNATTGAIDVSASTPNTYTVSYTTAGACPNSSNVSVTITALDNASFAYGASSYCVIASDPTPTILGLAGGTFSSTAGLFLNASTGTIDVSASTPATYSVTYTTSGSCPNSSSISVTINASITPTFNSVAAICAGDALSALPLSSNNGITGTWSPALDNLNTTNYTFTPDASQCATTASLTIVVNPCICAINIWTGASSSDWNDANNWSCALVPTSSCNGGKDNALIPTGVLTTPLVSGTFGVGNLEIEAGSSVIVDGKLEICGNFIHNGMPITGTGDLELMGSTVQDLSGTGTLNNLTLNNGNGASLLSGSSMIVTNSLVLISGTFTNLGNVTLSSNASGTAYLDDFTGTGFYAGDINVERFVTDGFASGLGQRYFGSPVAGANITGLNTTYTGYPLGQLVPSATCDPNNLDVSSPYSNLFEWHEEGPFLNGCYQSGWYAIAPSTNLTPGRGYSGWMDNTSTLSISGTPNTGAISFTTLNSGSSVANAEGWHLLSNPYPSPMNINAVTADGFTSPQYYNAASGAYSGTFQPVLVAGTEVPIMQGFVAHTAGPNTFSPTNADRIASNNPNFAKSNTWFDYKLDIEVSVNGNADITYLYYSDANSTQFDSETDCIKRHSDADKPTLYTKMNGDELSLNGLHLNDLGTSVSMGLIAPETATYTFNFDGLASFPSQTSIYLEDLVTGEFHNVSLGSYSFEADPINNGSERFMIHFVLPASFNLIETSCENTNASLIENTIDGRSFVITMNDIQVVNGILDGSSNILASGEYTVEVVDIYGGSQFYHFSVEEIEDLEANILASNTAIETGEAISFEYDGFGANHFEWYVNGTLVAQTEILNYTFNQSGTYEIQLVASSSDCSLDVTQIVSVEEKTTSIIDLTDTGSLNIYTLNANVVLDLYNPNAENLEMGIYNLLGQEMLHLKMNSSGIKTIASNGWASGYYIVKVQFAEQVIKETILISK